MHTTDHPARFALRARHIVTPEGVIDGMVQVEDGRIAAVSRGGDGAGAGAVIDAGSAWVFPGLVDTHVHLNEPGRTEWEGFVTGTAAAAAGGVTTLVDMPLNSDPVTVTVAALSAKRAAAEGRITVDVGAHAGLVPGHVDDLPGLIDGGVLGVKAFLVYSGIPEFPAATQAELAAAMPLLAEHRIPLLVHAEVESSVDLAPGDPRSYARYLASRPVAWEVDAIGWMIAMARETGCMVHIVHLAAADALPLLTAARAEGLPVTVETCPHYLHVEAGRIPDGATAFKCAPPIREAAHREQLWAALVRGDLDFVVSDHSPCPPSMKELESGDFMKAWGGIASLQLGLPILLTECRARGIDPSAVARWMAEGPARFAGLYPRKGAIAPGSDADLVLVHPQEAFIVDPATLLHRHPVTPYAHETLYGRVEKTYLRGRVVYDSQRGVVPGQGQWLVRS
jgi:allantoinase